MNQYSIINRLVSIGKLKPETVEFDKFKINTPKSQPIKMKLINVKLILMNVDCKTEAAKGKTYNFRNERVHH